MLVKESNSQLFKRSIYYKPEYYPWAVEAAKIQNSIHWTPEEVPFGEDIKDWHSKLNDSERYLLTQIFKFFTQADIEVCSNYTHNLISTFKNENIMWMVVAFANIEVIHIFGYSMIVETLGMDDSIYKMFMEYKEMKDKWDFLQKFDGDTIHDLLVRIAVFGSLTEGLQLYASFAILMYFPMTGRMKGMGQIVSWSIRDESLHANSMEKLFHTLSSEHKKVDMKAVQEAIIVACDDVVKHEDAFIDIAFSEGYSGHTNYHIEEVTQYSLKQYVRYIADLRLTNLGIRPRYGVSINPLPWMDNIISLTEFANFFETRVTEYSKNNTTGDWNDVFQKT